MLPASLPTRALSMVLLALLPTTTKPTATSSPNRMIPLCASGRAPYFVVELRGRPNYSL